MRRILWLITGALFFALAAIGTVSLAVAIVDRTPPIVYEDASALSPTAPRGGTLEVEFKVFRSRNCSVESRRWLTDSAGQQHTIPSYTFGPSQMAHETYHRSITIPSASALGPATYQVGLDYACNLIHRFGFPIRVVSPPVRFTIVPNEGLVPFNENEDTSDG